MNKLNVGDYVRTPKGIAKIIAVNKDVELNYINGNAVSLDTITIVCDKGYTISESYPTSPNIIDLIEIGDYVNGYKVIDIVKGFKVIIDKLEVDTTTGLYHNMGITNIESVVTKEQFENISYKVGE